MAQAVADQVRTITSPRSRFGCSDDRTRPDHLRKPGSRVTRTWMGVRVTLERTWMEWGDVDPILQLGAADVEGDVDAWANRLMGGLRSPNSPGASQ
jgi:hypothetical protein